MRRLLLFDVLADDFDGRTSAAAGKVAGRPQRAAPQLFADAGVIFLRIMRLETPFRLFTRLEMATFGG